jgi:glutathione S-transferase
MKLYYSPGACALGCQIALREAGMKFDLVKVDLQKKESPEGDFKKVNPKGYVPCVKLDSGEVLTEGAVILQWIADQHPEKKLLPKFGGMDRYRAMEWLNFISTEFHKGLGAFFNPKLNDDAKSVMVTKLNARLDFVNNHLKSNQFFLGSEFSVIDAYFYNMIRWAQPTKTDITPYKNILAFMERMSSRPSVRAAVEAEGLKI